MRDLKADLELCNKATPGPWEFNEYNDDYDVDIWSRAEPWRVANVGLLADIKFIAAAREGWPEAIKRAIKAEAENAKLHKVADAAREFISSTGCNSKECKKCDPNIGFCMWSGIGQAIVELYKEPSHD